jgi:hypothetical protein
MPVIHGANRVATLEKSVARGDAPKPESERGIKGPWEWKGKKLHPGRAELENTEKRGGSEGTQERNQGRSRGHTPEKTQGEFEKTTIQGSQAESVDL